MLRRKETWLNCSDVGTWKQLRFRFLTWPFVHEFMPCLMLSTTASLYLQIQTTRKTSLTVLDPTNLWATIKESGFEDLLGFIF